MTRTYVSQLALLLCMVLCPSEPAYTWLEISIQVRARTKNLFMLISFQYFEYLALMRLNILRIRGWDTVLSLWARGIMLAIQEHTGWFWTSSVTSSVLWALGWFGWLVWGPQEVKTKSVLLCFYLNVGRPVSALGCNSCLCSGKQAILHSRDVIVTLGSQAQPNRCVLSNMLSSQLPASGHAL